MRSTALARMLCAAAGVVTLASASPVTMGAPAPKPPVTMGAPAPKPPVAMGALAPKAPAQRAWLDEPPRLYTFKLDDAPAWRSASGGARLPLLDAFRDAAVDPSSGLRHYFAGPWGRWRAQPWWTLAWSGHDHDGGRPPKPPGSADHDGEHEAHAPLIEAEDGPGSQLRAAPASEEPLFGFEPFAGAARALSLVPWHDPSFTTPVIKTPGAIFASNGFDALWSLPPAKPVPNWRCRRRPVRMMRYGGESDAFLLVRCDGSVAAEAFDRLTLMAREAGAPRPGELLPDDPDPEAIARGEWAPGVRLVHPRLLWAMQRVADAFPWRTIYVFSGYRHDPSGVRPKPGTHHSMHSEGRAMDIYVTGIPKAALFQLCRTLEDVGCGFYPNNKFVHVDVRPSGSGHPLWIDVSTPGEPSRYVDAWPGVVEGGALIWDGAAQRAQHGAASALGTEASCTTRKPGG